MRARKSATGSVRLIPSPSFPVRPPQIPLKTETSGNGFAAFSLQPSAFCSSRFSRSHQLTTKKLKAESSWQKAVFYQLDLMTPGISPLSASDRKHRRQMPNLRRKARGRPHSWHRLCLRLLNFGFRASFTRFAVVAIILFFADFQFLGFRLRQLAPASKFLFGSASSVGCPTDQTVPCSL